MTTTYKLRAPNPDMNGVKVEGYDRVQMSEDGYFEVHDSNLAAKLQAAPWNFTIVPRAGGEGQKPARDNQRSRDDLEAKDLKDYTREELVAYLTERGHTPAEDTTDADLLAAAQLVKEEADKKKNPAPTGKKKDR